jgi:hypothetical protein
VSDAAALCYAFKGHLCRKAFQLTARHFFVCRFVELYCDFDIAPTFLARRELKAIFAAAAASSSKGIDASVASLGYAAFIEAAGRTALVALSKPAFQHLYPTARDKVAVLLEMWGLADPHKLAEIQRRPRIHSGAAARPHKAS